MPPIFFLYNIVISNNSVPVRHRLFEYYLNLEENDMQAAYDEPCGGTCPATTDVTGRRI